MRCSGVENRSRAPHFAFIEFVELGDRWAAGFLYLTNFRLIWVPGSFSFYRPRDMASESIRLRQLKEVWSEGRLFGRQKLHVRIGDREYKFFFVAYIHPFVGTGDPNGHKTWLQALKVANEERTDA